MTEVERRLADLAKRVRAGMRPGLDGIGELDRRCGAPSRRLRAAIVAGTNGKGTCCRALEAIAIAHGLRVGLFTSPHRSRFNQRFRIDGHTIDDTTLISWLNAVDHEDFTFFEVSAAMAFWGFDQAGVDLAILEVGMGGRLDAVNLVDGDAAAVVSISRDHEEFLGSDLAGIAAEKLGVARSGRPLVLGPGMEPYEALARQTGAEIMLNGGAWRSDSSGVDTPIAQLSRPAHLLFDRLWDAASVAVPLAQALGLTDREATRDGLERFRHPLRGERIGGVTFDACHNEAGIGGFAEWASKQAPEAELMVALSGRDPAVLEPFMGSGRRWWVVEADHPKATPAEQLAEALCRAGETAVAMSRRDALDYLRRRSTAASDSLLAFGSIYAMGPLRDALENIR